MLVYRCRTWCDTILVIGKDREGVEVLELSINSALSGDVTLKIHCKGEKGLFQIKFNSHNKTSGSGGIRYHNMLISLLA